MIEREEEWWKNKLAEDIYATLKAKEQSLPTFGAQSQQLWIRRHLVDWLAVIAGELRICTTAQHLGVYLLDYFMDCMTVEQSQLHLVAIVCLVIAVKFEDYFERVPRYSAVHSYLPTTDRPYQSYEFLAMELTVLRLIAWDLCVPTAAHFLPYFLQVAVDEDDLRDGMSIPSKVVVTSHLEKYANYFLEISLQDHTFRGYSPSLIAAACIASARICLHLTPTWPKQMELMTDYYLEELLPCVQKMLGIHQQDGQQQSLHSPVISPYQPSDCVPCGISPNNYLPSVSYNSGTLCSGTNGQFSYGCETLPGNMYQTDYRSDSLSMRQYYQTSMISKSYVPHQNLVQNHSYRTTIPYMNTAVISYSSATQMGPRLLPGCRGS